jgi:hypothetical protein
MARPRLGGRAGRSMPVRFGAVVNVLWCGKSEYDNVCFGVVRDLSGSIALQRSVLTVCLTVFVRCGGQNDRLHKRLSGSEMIEWE